MACDSGFEYKAFCFRASQKALLLKASSNLYLLQLHIIYAQKLTDSVQLLLLLKLPYPTDGC
jgi:hypothetical protein